MLTITKHPGRCEGCNKENSFEVENKDFVVWLCKECISYMFTVSQQDDVPESLSSHVMSWEVEQEGLK